jgi:hypothetical protein
MAITPAAPGSVVPTVDGLAMMPFGGTFAARDAVPTGGSRSGPSASRRVAVPRPILGQSLVVSTGPQFTVLNARLVDSVLDEIGSTRSLLGRT